MLIDCPECKQKISSNAAICVHCAYPIKERTLSNVEYKSNILNPIDDKKVPIWEKSNLTLPEAAEYSNIGINRLTMLINKPNCNFVLHVGNKKLIKRKLFDEFISSIDII